MKLGVDVFSLRFNDWNAFELLEYAKRIGAGLAIVNREETPLDPIADVIVREQIGPTMAMVWPGSASIRRPSMERAIF